MLHAAASPFAVWDMALGERKPTLSSDLVDGIAKVTLSADFRERHDSGSVIPSNQINLESNHIG